MQDNEIQHWDHECDVLVVGSGNGALTAALAAADEGADVLIVEKAHQFGGTSASSGGGVWIPNNRYAVAAGAEDSLHDARDYLRHVSPEGRVNPELLETYVTEGPAVINYLHENTNWVRYQNLAYYPDFHRGDSSYDRYYSDPEVQPNPCLAPVLQPLFYAVALYPGEMGTAGGLVIDPSARVLREDGTAIDGLYACGNTTAALLPTYPGPGATLGPAMVFGFIAGKHVSSL